MLPDVARSNIIRKEFTIYNNESPLERMNYVTRRPLLN